MLARFRVLDAGPYPGPGATPYPAPGAIRRTELDTSKWDGQQDPMFGLASIETSGRDPGKSQGRLHPALNLTPWVLRLFFYNVRDSLKPS